MERRRTTSLGLAVLSVMVGVMAVAVLLWAVGSAGASPPMGPLAQGGAPLLLNYQGRLADPSTSLPKPDGAYTITFKIHDAETGGSLIWSETQVVTVTRGLFNVLLGSSTALSASDFDGTSRWLELEVEGETLSPRERMVSVPYAIQAEEAKNAATAPWAGLTGVPAGFADGVDNTGAGGDYWALTGNAGTNPTTNFLGTTDGVSLTLAVSGTAALRLEPNATSPNLIGGYSGNSVTGGVKGATIGGGGSSDFAANRVTDDWGAVGGGSSNQAGDDAGTTDYATYATVGGGEGNAAGGSHATIGGGGYNSASGEGAIVGGGHANDASGDYAAAVGGWVNTSSGYADAVGGGAYNAASGGSATVGGGESNSASGGWATVGGGLYNAASDEAATVGGGYWNTASGTKATVPGGASNTAQGDYSFAAGRRAKANHDGAFVWADSTDADFASSANDQFLVRATGGVSFEIGSADFQINGSTPWLGSPYSNVVVVAKSGGDFTSVQDALNSITDAIASNPYLVLVAPGAYTETVTMKQYVDIEGAGELATKITYTGSGSASTGTVVGADNAELRFLTVENTGGASYAIAIYNGSASPRLTHVTATASGATSGSYGVYNKSSSSPTMTDVTATALGGSLSYGMYNFESSPTMTNVTASASGGGANIGVYNYESSPTIQNSVISGSGGTNNYGIRNHASSGSYTVTVDHCEITGSTNTILNDVHFTTLVGASLLDGGEVAPNGGTITCTGAYDESYIRTGPGSFYANTVVVAKSGGDYTSIQDALDSITDASASNPYLVWVAPGAYTETVTMKQYVDIEGAGELVTKITYTGSGSNETGTVVGANNAELRFLTVENTGGDSFGTAIYNDSASPRLTHVTATASGGGGWKQGVCNRYSSSPTMTNVTATASGVNINSGVYNYSDSSPTMTNVTATASGGSQSHGVMNTGSSPTMTNVTAIASGGSNNFGVGNDSSSPTIQNSVISGSGGTDNYGIYNTASSGSYTVKVNNSEITGSTNTIYNDSHFTTLVGASLLSGGAVTGTGTETCAGVYDESYTFYSSTCP